MRTNSTETTCTYTLEKGDSIRNDDEAGHIYASIPLGMKHTVTVARPAEPEYLGSVVTDIGGNVYVRATLDGQDDWVMQDPPEDAWVDWKDIASPRIQHMGWSRHA